MKISKFDSVESGYFDHGVLTLHSGTQILEISLYEDSLIRLRYYVQRGISQEAKKETGLPPILIKEGTPIPGEWEETAQGWKLGNHFLKITINSDPFSLKIWDAFDQLVLTQSGQTAYNQQGTRVSATWQWDGKPVVGLGEKVGSLDKRGKHWVLWNTDVVPHLPSTDPLYESIPWLLSKHWGMFLNNSYRSEWDIGKKQSEHFWIQADGGVLDQWIFLGENPLEILNRWTDWIGKMPLPPLWAMGHHQSRYSYHPQTQVLETARRMRERHIPCDVIHLDIHYMDGYRDFTWDRIEFPDPEGLNHQLHDLGFRVVTIVDPGVKKDETYGVCADGLAKDMFCSKETGEVFVGEVWPGPSVFPDFSRERVRLWWGEQQVKLLASGVDGIWNDMNEPSVFNVPGKTFPSNVCHGEFGELSHAEIHNRYGNLMAQAAYEGLLNFAPQKRPFVLTRAGFAGVQRYAAVWLGDNSSWWEHLAQALSMSLNMGLSGVSFVGTDVGGFLEDGEGELLARWAQLGAFTPFCRNHSNVETIDQEPWAFGEEIEQIYRQAMELRYRLLPTLYTLFEEASRTGNPIMRALLLEFPQDEETWRVNDEFLFGPDVLVAPVIQKGACERLVYLPEGMWQHRSSGKSYRGNQHIIVEAPLAEIPMFMREGAILGLGCGGEVTHTDLLKVETLEFYAHAPFSTAQNFYADSGDGYEYHKGEYRSLNVSAIFDGEILTLTARQEGNWEPLEQVNVEIHWNGKISRHEWMLADKFVVLQSRMISV